MVGVSFVSREKMEFAKGVRRNVRGMGVGGGGVSPSVERLWIVLNPCSPV